MTFDCSEYFILSLLHEYFDCKFKRKSWLAQSSFWNNRVPHWPIGPFSVLRCDAEREKYESRVI